jgi:hypothetical protein
MTAGNPGSEPVLQVAGGAGIPDTDATPRVLTSLDTSRERTSVLNGKITPHEIHATKHLILPILGSRKDLVVRLAINTSQLRDLRIRSRPASSSVLDGGPDMSSMDKRSVERLLHVARAARV